MASILDRYGIKEVADVTFYTIDDTTKTRGVPVLYLDTLKVSTIEQTAEEADAKGGKGNAPLVTWDYGKEINVTLEDALFSPKSLALMFADNPNNAAIATTGSIFKTIPADQMIHSGSSYYTKIKGVQVQINGASFYDEKGSQVSQPTTTEEYAYATGTITTQQVTEIEVSNNSFPGTYYITGDTYARSESTGKDEFFQFIIPKAKVLSGNTITLEAEGDPSVFSMNLKVLRPSDGVMMKLVKYGISGVE